MKILDADDDYFPFADSANTEASTGSCRYNK